MNQLLGVVVTLGWENEGLPYWAQVLAAVKVGCCFLLSDVYSFNSPSCVVCLTCFTVAASQSTLCCVLHACTAILFCVIPFDCSFVLAQSFLQRSSSFSNVHTFAFSTGYLLHNSSFLPRWLWLLCLCQLDFAECVPLDVKVVLIPSYLQPVQSSH